MSRKSRARRCAQGAPTRAPRTLHLEGLEIRNYLSASPGDISATPQVTIIPSVSTAVSGYTPAQVTNAYGFNQVKFGNTVGNGAGQTIAIVDAFDDPSIATNLATFDKQFGLADPKLTKVNETGGAKMPVASQSWAREISLDVEWAHAMAPGANILLVEANSAGLTDLLTAVNYARSQPTVNVVSMSWGTSEFSGQQAFDSYFTTPAGHSGVTFVASSGDNGAGTSWPAVSPNVVAVGGTTLSISASGADLGETAWSGSGGGTSTLYSTPAYQVGMQSTGHRTVPDVSFDASPSTGFAVYDTAGGSAGWMEVGGTSAGAPQWAALVAIADQGRAQSNQAALSGTDTNLYKLPAADFHDVTSGSNGAYGAKAGYDEVTGRGSPSANLVVRDLVGVTFATAPATFIGPRVIVYPPIVSGSAGAHVAEASIDIGSNSISTSITASPSMMVGVTSAIHEMPSPGSQCGQAAPGSSDHSAGENLGLASGLETRSESTSTAPRIALLNAVTSSATSIAVNPSAAIGVDAALADKQADPHDAVAPAGGALAAKTPLDRQSAVDECFIEGDIARPEFEDAVALSAESTGEDPATTDLAILAGISINGGGTS